MATPPEAANPQRGGDPIELEAAEALAYLAHSTMSERVSRRPSQGVKTESPPRDSVISIPQASDQAVAHQQCQKICRAMVQMVKVEQAAELPKPSPTCTKSYASFSGSKSRKKLTETEKEARRIRRVLANRESARQTIRRRQAWYEDLIRKAASLESENKNLKREMKLAVKEYDILKTTNESLKAQMAGKKKTDVEETRVDSESNNAEISTSPYSNYPFIIYNQFAPYSWPAIIQPSNPMQLQNGSQNAIVVPSVPMQAFAKPDSFHESGTPLYIMPCPWFFPLPDHGNGSQLRPSFDLNVEKNGTSMNNHCGASSSSKTIAHVQNCHPPLPITVTTEASSSTEAAFGFPPYGRGQHTGLYLNALPEMKQDLISPPSKEEVDAAATAAEARKRRKELKRLKSLHCRQVPMHC